MTPIMRQILLAPQGIVKKGLVAWYDFTDPAGSQVLTDKSGNGNHGQNGSAAGADTNDVTFDGVKAVFATDDYIKTSAIPSIYLNGTWSIYSVGIFNSVTGKNYVSLGKAGTHESFSLHMISDTSLSFRCINSVAGDTNVGPILISTPSAYFTKMASDGASASLTVYLPTPTTRNMAITSMSAVNPLLAFGCRAGDTGGIVSAETAYYSMIYSRVTSFAEDKQNYKALKTVLATRGVSLI